MLDFRQKRLIKLGKRNQNRFVVPTPFEELNTRLRGGLRDGEFGVIMGLSGAGKSISLLNTSICGSRSFLFGRNDRVVYHFLLEMNLDDIEERMLLACNRITLDELQQSKEIEAPNLPLVIIDSLEFENSMIGIDQFLQGQLTPPGLIVIDYAGLLTDVIGQSYEAWIKLSKQMEGLAKRYKCPVWTATQITQPSDFEKGILFDERHIASGKGFRNNATVFMSLNQTADQREKRIATFNPFKCRRGAIEPFTVKFNPEHCWIGNLADKEENDEVCDTEKDTRTTK